VVVYLCEWVGEELGLLGLYFVLGLLYSFEYNNSYKGALVFLFMVDDIVVDEGKRILGRDAQRNNILAVC